jgi:hypothetical protein
MSILVRFTAAPSMTSDLYDTSISRLESELDQWPPDGMEYHCAFTSGGKFRVSEVWESQAKFEVFGEKLMPILTEIGVELEGPPEIFEVHNTIDG